MLTFNFKTYWGYIFRICIYRYYTYIRIWHRNRSYVQPFAKGLYICTFAKMHFPPFFSLLLLYYFNRFKIKPHNTIQHRTPKGRRLIGPNVFCTITKTENMHPFFLTNYPATKQTRTCEQWCDL